MHGLAPVNLSDLAFLHVFLLFVTYMLNQLWLDASQWHMWASINKTTALKIKTFTIQTCNLVATQVLVWRFYLYMFCVYWVHKISWNSCVSCWALKLFCQTEVQQLHNICLSYPTGGQLCAVEPKNLYIFLFWSFLSQAVLHEFTQRFGPVSCGPVCVAFVLVKMTTCCWFSALWLCLMWSCFFRTQFLKSKYLLMKTLQQICYMLYF